jgi:hypothetical protein
MHSAVNDEMSSTKRSAGKAAQKVDVYIAGVRGGGNPAIGNIVS